jgi:undecaprenyl diphosphate synthase
MDSDCFVGLLYETPYGVTTNTVADNLTSSHDTPSHVAIIMDGNGRWATNRGLPRIEGHRRGAESIQAITTECARLAGVEQLTLYALSTENWQRRPRREIHFLMRLLWHFLRTELKLMQDHGIKLEAIGDTEVFPVFVRKKLQWTKEKTQHFDNLHLCLALNYGGRDEITRAVRVIARQAAAGVFDPDAITEQLISDHLDTAGMPEPDLLIRTAGEMRVSNFLLWQCSYSELYVTDTLWPDFREADLHKAFESYRNRRRKFGGVQK